jgi:hypothetical protein
MSHSLTQDRLRAVLDYSIVSGRFYWKVSPSSKVRAGDLAGCRHNTKGYLRISVDGVEHWAHRLVCLWLEGVFPEHVVDHVNGDTAFNAWSNLRKATKSQNQHNRRLQRNSTTGFKNVNKAGDRFRAIVSTAGRRKYGPLRNTAEEAYADACRLREELHGSFANHG